MNTLPKASLKDVQEHTPGPWRHQGWVPCWTYIPVKDAQHNVVASCCPDIGHGYSRDQALANANLITAAPDMLIALKLIEHSYPSNKHIAHVRAAIAKAEGQP